MMHDFELHEFFYSPKNVLLKALLYMDYVIVFPASYDLIELSVLASARLWNFFFKVGQNQHGIFFPKLFWPIVKKIVLVIKKTFFESSYHYTSMSIK